MCSTVKFTTGVLLVMGDGFFNQYIVKYFGLVIKEYPMYWFQLFDTGLTDTFGEHGCSLIWGEVSQMIKYKTEEYLDAAVPNVCMLLSNQQHRDMDLETKLEAFSECKCEYSQFYINTMHGSKVLHGSSMSNQKHSITLCHMNDGHTKIKKYCEQPITLVKDLFGRQQRHILIMKNSL